MSWRTFAPLLAAILLLAGPARAQLTIEIIGGGANQIPIAVLPFAGESVLPQSITEIVEQDLSRSGRFRAIFVGGVNPLPTQIAGIAFTLTAAQTRLTAHKIADFIYEKMTGERGVFSTRIAYIVKQGTRHELRVADADGQNAQSILISSEPIMSPAWSPDGARMAYVSFQNKKPILFVQNLTASKQPAPVANYRGSNSAPAWSPDGKQLAAVLTKDGTSQIYLMSPDGTSLRRLTFSAAIDTEPFFTPDGQSIYFTSDRGGSPQIYRMPASGGEPVRMTFEGDYNVSPRVSPDGKVLAYISRVSGRFQLMVMDLESKQVQTLTEGQRDESPSFAPNGRIILYATNVDNRGVLAAVSSDGRFRQRLGIQAADVREPSWGPFLGN